MSPRPGPEDLRGKSSAVRAEERVLADGPPAVRSSVPRQAGPWDVVGSAAQRHVTTQHASKAVRHGGFVFGMNLPTSPSRGSGVESQHARNTFSNGGRRMGGRKIHAWPGTKAEPCPRKFAIDAAHNVRRRVCRPHPPNGKVQCVRVEGDALRDLDGRRWDRRGCHLRLSFRAKERRAEQCCAATTKRPGRARV